MHFHSFRGIKGLLCILELIYVGGLRKQTSSLLMTMSDGDARIETIDRQGMFCTRMSVSKEGTSPTKSYNARSIFFIIKAFVAGVILSTGFIHLLPDVSESLTSRCFNENPYSNRKKQRENFHFNSRICRCFQISSTSTSQTQLIKSSPNTYDAFTVEFNKNSHHFSIAHFEYGKNWNYLGLATG